VGTGVRARRPAPPSPEGDGHVCGDGPSGLFVPRYSRASAALAARIGGSVQNAICGAPAVALAPHVVPESPSLWTASRRSFGGDGESVPLLKCGQQVNGNVASAVGNEICSRGSCTVVGVDGLLMRLICALQLRPRRLVGEGDATAFGVGAFEGSGHDVLSVDYRVLRRRIYPRQTPEFTFDPRLTAS
jgi:hypothetical protein